MRTLAFGMIFVAGCAQLLGLKDFPTGQDASGPGDAPGDGSSCPSFSSIADTCSLAGSGLPMVISENPATFNTDTDVLIEGSAQVAVPIAEASDGTTLILATTFELGPSVTLTVTGSHPFGVIATEAITLYGAIDGGSHLLAGSAAAGSLLASACGAAAGGSGSPTNHNSTFDGTGGGGGGHSGYGGAGGSGNVDGTVYAGGIAGSGNSACPVAPTGGCPGGIGGEGDSLAANNMEGGAGGGAVYLASAVSIAIGGSISVGGAGGFGGGSASGANDGGGGGGGGAGGMIMLEAPLVDVEGILAANGGGGGEGGTFRQNGSNGADASASAQPALGGAGSNAGALGGNGGAGSSYNGVTPSLGSLVGAGGGGGGVGFIRITGSTMQNGTISPSVCQ
ncbi:MAG TPA: hypothetical protein VGG28_09115 [Kofleriaceae bacterium]|jgi:hypothetical protein